MSQSGARGGLSFAIVHVFTFSTLAWTNTFPDNHTVIIGNFFALDESGEHLYVGFRSQYRLDLK